VANVSLPILTFKKSLQQLLSESGLQPPQIPERMVWSSTSIKLFRKCKRKFFWRYIMRVRPRVKAGPLVIGDYFHQCLGKWYLGRRISMALLAERASKEMWEYFDTGGIEAYGQDEFDKITTVVRTFAGMCMGYAKVYEDDKQTWDIDRRFVEHEFQVNMGEFDLVGKIDLVTKHGNETKLVEHKTASKITENYIARLPLDTQNRCYIFAAICRGLKPQRLLYDVVKKCKLRRKKTETNEQFNIRISEDYQDRPDDYFYREDLMFSANDIHAFEFELRQTHAEYMAYVSGMFGDPLDPRTWTPNDGTCDEYYKLCEYFRLCTNGLDRGTAIGYEQPDRLITNINEEVN